jgi:hypothetical protein
MSRVTWAARVAAGLIGVAQARYSAEAQRLATPPLLISARPAPALAAQRHLFGQFIGDWSVEETHLTASGTWTRAHGEWHFVWILDGRAIQDVFALWAPTDWTRQTNRATAFGTTVRLFDTSANVWHVAWAGAQHGQLVTFTARSVGPEIVLSGRDNDGHPTRWIFSDVSANTFRWRAVTSYDHGQSWRVEQRMTMTRAARLAP